MAYKDLVKKRTSELRWYRKNIDKIRGYKQKARRLRLDYIKRLKETSCKDCGNYYPSYVMDFDHRQNESKLDTVNRLASIRYGWKKLKEEIQKCDIVCANCHRIRTYKRKFSTE